MIGIGDCSCEECELVHEAMGEGSVSSMWLGVSDFCQLLQLFTPRCHFGSHVLNGGVLGPKAGSKVWSSCRCDVDLSATE